MPAPPVTVTPRDAAATAAPTAAPQISPPPVPPKPTATSQTSSSPNNDYLKVVGKDYSGDKAATLTVEYQAYPRPNQQFYISATAWRSGAGTSWCGATALPDIPRNHAVVNISFPWAAMPAGCTPETFSSIYACLAFDGKETVCVNVYK